MHTSHLFFISYCELILSDSKESGLQCRRPRFDPWLERSPEEGNGNPLQYSYLENSTDRGAWWATVHGVTEESDVTKASFFWLSKIHYSRHCHLWWSCLLEDWNRLTSLPACVFAQIHHQASLVAQRLKRLSAMWEAWVQSLAWEGPLEKEMATHSSILTWRTPWAEESGEL